jgi:hypothetical protein
MVVKGRSGAGAIDDEWLPSAVMAAGFHVQQRNGRVWRTLTSPKTHAAATDLAERLRQGLEHLPHLPAPSVRVVSTDELAEQDRISRNAAEMLRRSPPHSINRP